MIINFSIFESLGYNEEVSELTEYVWKLYKSGEKEIDLSQYSQDNMSIFINKLFLNEYKSNVETSMTAMLDDILYKKTKNIIITINRKHKPTIMTLEHELKHVYDFIKAGAVHLKMKDKKDIGPFIQITSNYENIQKFIYMMYIIEMTEIEAYFHSDIRNFKENKHKFKNDINKYIKYSRLQQNYDILKYNDISEIFSGITMKDKNDVMNFYYTVKNTLDKFSNLKGVERKFELLKTKIKSILQNISFFSEEWDEYSEEEINKFYDKFEKEIEKKKKIYLKYIGRLYAYFS